MSEAAPTPTETADLRYLDPAKLRFFRHGAALRLTVEDEACYLKVAIMRAFPLSHPHQYLSVRDAENKEIGLLVDPTALDRENQSLLAEELERRYVVPVIRRIIGIKERFGTVDWEVETDRGVRTFTTRNMREKVVQPSPGRYLLTDVDENRYDVRDLAALDPASQSWLLRHL
jgi:Domain of unknown function (DUF1854)